MMKNVIKQGFKSLFRDNDVNFRIHIAEKIIPDKQLKPIANRVFEAYKKMKEAEEIVVPLAYKPSLMWQKHIDESFSELVISATNNDLNRFHYFLSNSSSWDTNTGIEDNIHLKKYSNSFLKRKFLENVVYYNLFREWRYYFQSQRPITKLSRPNYTNITGARIDDVIVNLDSFWGDIYGEVMAGLIKDIDRPVVAELGGGCGRLAYYLIRNYKSNLKYIIFDLPEILCVSAYYLMCCFPNCKTYLFGESNNNRSIPDNVDFIFMPPCGIDLIENNNVNLFLNECSLGEMTPSVAENYLVKIDLVTKDYFFHMNHENYRNTFHDNEKSLIAPEYLEYLNNFKLVFKYPEMKHMLYPYASLDEKSNTFWYLFQKKYIE